MNNVHTHDHNDGYYCNAQSPLSLSDNNNFITMAKSFSAWLESWWFVSLGALLLKHHASIQFVPYYRMLVCSYWMFHYTEQIIWKNSKAYWNWLSTISSQSILNHYHTHSIICEWYFTLTPHFHLPPSALETLLAHQIFFHNIVLWWVQDEQPI